LTDFRTSGRSFVEPVEHPAGTNERTTMPTSTAHAAFPSRVLTIALTSAAPCEHDWTADGGYVFCHDCGVGAAPAAPAAGMGAAADPGRR
jgi:hypothetical protein